MAHFSDYMEQEILDWGFTVAGVTRPTAWYVELYTAAPTDAGGGTALTGNGHARQSVTWTRSGSTLNPSADLTFGPYTASMGTVTHFGVFDALTSGNMLGWNALTTSRAIGNGDSAKFTTSQLSISLD